MLIGVPKEIKKMENRVGLVPASVRELVHHGHKVMIETGAGAGIGIDDAAYKKAGADGVGIGSSLYTPTTTPEVVERRARALVKRWAEST